MKEQSMTEAEGTASVRVIKGARCRPPIIEDGPKFEGTDVCVENLFNYRELGLNLHTFLDHFPSVSREQALEELEKMVRENAKGVFHSREDTVGGTPIFIGTSVPIRTLFDCLAQGYNLKDFHYDFPSVFREQTHATLEMAREALEREAYRAPNSVCDSDREIMGGVPVFAGTRLPVKNLFDCLASAYSLKDFYYEFPSASREQLVASLEMAQRLLDKQA
jgi:uncharacterized protein (DUF433 family)